MVHFILLSIAHQVTIVQPSYILYPANAFVSSGVRVLSGNNYPIITCQRVKER